MFKPSAPFTVAFVLLKPTSSNIKGVKTKTYPTIESAIQNKDNIIHGSFKSYGGTERQINEVYLIEDTAYIETWYRPDITSDCRLAILESSKIYDIINEPEDIELRHQWMKFRVKRYKGDI